ncbi:MAG: [protein-PII] uridylyltransferase [bacterium]|nr:[protein-PII] uridylyltransferase [bacterium]MDT8396061.1 [protein-PII] uridylyltransferase [bacterium]
MSLIGVDALAEIKDQKELGKELQKIHQAAWDTLKLEHDSGRDSLEIITQLTRLMDEIIGFVFEHTADRLRKEGVKEDRRLTLLALGSYGRRELAPHSDVDLLFFVPEEISEWTRKFTERMLYVLWDTGLDVGYSTRTTRDCFSLAQDNYDVLTSILDARFLQGDPAFFESFKTGFKKKVLDKVGTDFVRARLDGMEERLQRQGGTIYVLEPNLKEGMGGLRDIHTSLWVAKVLFAVDSFEELTGIEGFSILDREDYLALAESLNFLLRVRCDLHFASNTARDLLTMERQQMVADKFGIRHRKGIQAVERFMQEYYRHTGQAHHITMGIIKRSMESRRRSPRILQRLRERDLGNGFFAREGNLYTREDPVELFEKQPALIMELFKRYQTTNLELSPALSQGVRRSLKLVNNSFRRNSAVRDLFFSILEQDRRLYDTLLLMNELRFLGKYLPEFATIHCKMQHDYYHTYTVDEHSIRAIKEIVELPGAKEPGMQVYQQVWEEARGERTLLFLTALMHDVGKGKGANHAETGAEMAARAGRRFGLPKDQIETMMLLIRQHLLLSHVAQRRDLHEERTILETARLVGTVDRLKLLFLLTMADLKAVGPGVWNDWKASLITELFLETYQAIEQGGVSREEVLERMLLARTIILQRLSEEFGADRVGAELDVLTERAYMLYRPKMLSHLVKIRFKMGDDPIYVSWRQAREGGYTDMYVVARDHTGLFAKIAGVLSANNINILGAQILTRRDGIVFDVLRVTDTVMKPIQDRVKTRIVNRELRKVIDGEFDVEELFTSRKLSMPLNKRDRTAIGVPTRIEIDNDISEEHTVIDVYATDRIGLLYRITSTLAGLGLSIHTAKVSTKVDQAVDVFYVKGSQGEKVSDPGELERIRKTLLESLAASGS